MDAVGEHAFARDALLRRQLDYPTTFRLPVPLSAYLDRLVRLCDDFGEETNRQEVMRALIAGTPPDGSACADKIRRYKSMKCGELAGLFPPKRKIVYLNKPKSGRRRRAGRQGGGVAGS